MGMKQETKQNDSEKRPDLYPAVFAYLKGIFHAVCTDAAAKHQNENRKLGDCNGFSFFVLIEVRKKNSLLMP